MKNINVKQKKGISLGQLGLFLVLIVLFILFTILTPIVKPGSTFFQYSRLLSSLNYAYFIGFLALGVTFVISTGGIDFSIGPVMFASALIAGQCLSYYQLPLWLCLIISIFVGFVFGLINGYMVAYRFLPSFVTSMASMQIAKGIGSVFTKTQSVTWPVGGQENSWFRYLVRYNNFPVGIFIFIGVAIICGFFLFRTKPGRYILSIGSNKEAVRLSGVSTQRWEMLAFIICGMFAGIAAIFYVATYSTVQPGLGDAFNNEAIAACVMGGTSMTGGKASIFGTVIGALIIAMLQEGILAFGLSISYQYVLTGLIVLGAVIVDARKNKKRV